MVMMHKVLHCIIRLHCHSAICLSPDDLIDVRKISHLDVPSVKICYAGFVELNQWSFGLKIK